MKIQSNKNIDLICKRKTIFLFRVLYISLHCADAFPPNDSGKDKELGFNINID
jgi:hypothetical protein